MTTIYALDRHTLLVTGRIQSNGEAGTQFDRATLTIDDATPAETLEVNILKDSDSEQDILAFSEGALAVVRHPDSGESLLFTIMDVEADEDNHTIFCESAGMELLNDNVGPWDNRIAYGVEWYVQRFFSDTDWVVGVNELDDLKRILKWEGESNKYERLLSIATQFDHAKVTLTVDMDGNEIKGKYINFRRFVGEDNGVIFEYGRNMKGATKKSNIMNLATALDATGATPEGSKIPINLIGFEEDDGRFFTPKNSRYVFDRLANNTWYRVIGGGKKMEDEYYKDFYNYDGNISQRELFNRTVTQLERRSKPELTYEFDLDLVGTDIRRGDTVYIKDLTFQPALMVAAQVSRIERDLVDNEIGKVTFTNFVELTSNLDDLVKNLSSKIDEAYNLALNNIQPVFSETEPLNPVEGMTWYKLAPLEEEPTILLNNARVANNQDRKVISTNVYRNSFWEEIPFDAQALYVKKLTGLSIENPYQIKAGSGNLRSVKGVSRMSDSRIGMDYEYLDGLKTRGSTTMSPGVISGSEYTQGGQFVSGYSLSADSVSLNSNYNGQSVGGALTSLDFYDTGWLQLTAVNGWRFQDANFWGYVRQVGKQLKFRGRIGGKAIDRGSEIAINLPVERFINMEIPSTGIYRLESLNGTGFNTHFAQCAIVNGRLYMHHSVSSTSYYDLGGIMAFSGT